MNQTSCNFFRNCDKFCSAQKHYHRCNTDFFTIQAISKLMCPDFEPVAPVVSRIDVAKQERGEGGWRNGKVSGCHFFLYGLLINLLLSSFVLPL